MEDFTRIKIDRLLTNKYFESEFYKRNQNISLTQILNMLLDMYLDGRVVKLSENNFNQVNECAKVLYKTNDEIVNYVLDRLELVPVETVSKIKMDVYKEHQKISVKKVSNKITSW